MSTLKIEDMLQLIESTTPKFDCPEIDAFIEKGNRIQDVVMVSSLESMKYIHSLRTKHGILTTRFSPYIPENQIILMAVPLGVDL